MVYGLRWRELVLALNRTFLVTAADGRSLTATEDAAKRSMMRMMIAISRNQG
jgi:hypothetical protein